MIKKIGKRLLPMLLAILLIATTLPMTALAAKTVEPIANKVSVTDSVGNGSLSNGTVTIVASGGLTSKTTNIITIKNTSGVTASISFDYKISNYDSHTFPAAEGSYSKAFIAGESVEFKITSKALFGKVTLTLKNFVFVEAADKVKMTVDYDSSLGSVSVDGTVAPANGIIEFDPAVGAKLAATPASGVEFIGFVNAADNTILSLNKNYNFTAANDTNIKAVFSKSAPWYMVEDKYLFDDLAVATAKAAASSANKTVVLMNNATLPAGNYTIPSGVILLIPFDSANTLYTTSPGHDGGTTNITPTPYRTLKMASGANITVNGAISLSAKHRAAQGSGYGCENSGAYGCINMEENSNIILNSGSNLYAWGFITGNGKVEANSGATVYEYFQFRDFRGGSISTSMEAEYGVFLFSQYYVQNIEAPLTLHAGAIEKTFVTITMSKMDFSEDVTFIGSEDAMFTIENGSVTKKYDGSRDRLIIEANGDISVAPITFSIGYGDNGITGISKNTANYELPITNNLTVIANSGVATISQDLSLLPGSEIIVREKAKCVLGKGISVYAYDADEWGTYTFSKGGNKKFHPLQYAPGRTYTRTEEDLADAKIQIEGLVDASAGYVYTTAGGANIYSIGSGKVITVAGTQTTTYQFVQGADYTADSNKAIPITPAKAKNADESYTETKSATTATTYTYNNTHGKWDDKGHIVTDDVTAPTCTEQGYTTYTCTCGYTYVGDYVNAKGHNYDSSVTKPTCTDDGYTTHTCANCGDSYTDSEVEASGHNYDSVVTKPTCTDDGYTTHTCANCGDSYTDSEVEASGHNYDSVVTKPTCTDDGYTTHTCANCGDSYTDSEVEASGHNYDSVVTKPTCTDDGYTTHTCANCGDSYTDSEVEATGHNYDSVVTKPTCTDDGYTTHTCANCGDSYTDSEVEATGHSYGDWTVTKKATHYEEGIKARECHCGDIETAVIAVIVCDIEDDGITSASELSALQNHLLDAEYIADDKIELFDMNYDGKINILDLIILKKFIAAKA